MDKSLYSLFYRFETNNWWFVGRRKTVFALLDMYYRRDCEPVLDAGCGTGATVQFLESYGRVVGLDIDNAALKFCKYRAHDDWVGASVAAIPFSQGTFGLVTLLDVLEHIRDDEAILLELYRVCRPGGLLIITVPAYRFLWSAHDVINHHERRYTAGELGRKVLASGFEIVRLTYGNTLLFPIVLLVRIYRNSFLKRRASSDWDFNNVPRLLNWMLTQVYGLEASLLRRLRFPFGVSVICVARKPVDQKTGSETR